MNIKRPEEIATYGIVGAPGTGKTHLLSTFRPDDWKEGDPPWAYVFACDMKPEGGMITLAKRGPDGLPLGAGIEYGVFTSTSLKAMTEEAMARPVALDELYAQVRKLVSLVNSPNGFPYKMVAIDSFTGFFNLAATFILYKRSRREAEKTRGELQLLRKITLDQPDWGETIAWVQWILANGFIPLPCMKVFTFHTAELRETIRTTGGGTQTLTTGVRPLIHGTNLPGVIDSMLEFKFYIDPDYTGPNGERRVHTIHTKMTPAKVSIGTFKRIEPADFKVWRERIQEALA